jgi:hypothetical protein
MHPNNTVMSLAVANKLLQLLKDGATIIMDKDYNKGIGLKDQDCDIQELINQLFDKTQKKGS